MSEISFQSASRPRNYNYAAIRTGITARFDSYAGSTTDHNPHPRGPVSLAAMCGIAGYGGPRKAVGVVFDQLKRLEYRGYDSAGVAMIEEDGIHVLKRAGKLTNLGELIGENPSDTHQAKTQTRWATHGAPTDENAHPHY